MSARGTARSPGWGAPESAPRVAFLLGKPPERSPVLPQVIGLLRRQGADVRVHLPHDSPGLPDWLAASDIVALRGLDAKTLSAVAEVERQGLRCCNTAAATIAVRNRDLVHRRLSVAGVPVPAAITAADVAAARRWAAGRRVVVKELDAGRGRGAGVVLWSDPDRDPPPAAAGPYLVQDWLPSDGVDVKLYVIGDHCAGLLKPVGAGRRSGTAFQPSHEMTVMARAAGAALGLSIYGVDVVDGPGGRAVVDVNAFPSCAGVPDAAEAIARTLIAQTPIAQTPIAQTPIAQTRAGHPPADGRLHDP